MTVTAGNDAAAIQAIVADLEEAWNTGDGARFARAFAEDADFVNVHGMRACGRQAIADGHDLILRTMYAGSALSMGLADVRLLRDGVALAHLQSRLQVPQGPLAGEHEALPSMVLTREGAGWTIAAFHNTFVRTPPPLR